MMIKISPVSCAYLVIFIKIFYKIIINFYEIIKENARDLLEGLINR